MSTPADETRAGFTRVEALAALLLAVLSVVFVADHDAWTPDEPRVIELARSAADGPRAVPLLAGAPFLEQPPLYYWAAGLAYRVLGQGPAAARAVSSLFGAGTLLLTALYGARLRGRRAGALAALSLGLSFQFFWIAHRIVVDASLAFFVAGAAYAALRGLTAARAEAAVSAANAQAPMGEQRAAGESGRAGEARIWLTLCYVAATLAYMSKGVVGVGLSGLAFLGTVAAMREPRLLLRARLWAAPLVFLSITTPYHLAVYREAGAEGLRTLVLANTIERAAGVSGPPAHAQPWWYYLAYLPLDLLPATLLVAPAVVAFARGRRSLDERERTAFEAPLAWLALGTVALSAATSKREAYLVPLMPGAAVLAGLWLDDLAAGRLGAGHVAYARGLCRALGLLLCLAGLALPVGARALGLGVALAAAGGVAAAALAWTGSHMGRRGRPAEGLAALAHGAVVAIATACATFVPWMDAPKSFGPFLTEARALIPEGRAVYLFSPDETAAGVVPFYTGRLARPLADVEALRRALAAEGDLYVFVIDKNDAAPLFRRLAPLGPTIVAAHDEIGRGARLTWLLHFEAPLAAGHP